MARTVPFVSNKRKNIDFTTNVSPSNNFAKRQKTQKIQNLGSVSTYLSVKKNQLPNSGLNFLKTNLKFCSVLSYKMTIQAKETGRSE